MWMIHFILTILVLFSSSEEAAQNERLMVDYVLEDYDPFIVPTIRGDGVITVSHQLELQQILEINEVDQYLLMYAFVQETWMDELLVWDPADFQNDNLLTLKVDKVWVPKTYMTECIEMDESVLVRVETVLLESTKNSTGNYTKVYENYPAIYKAACNMHVGEFPFDEQRCTFKFTSLSYTSRRVHYKDVKHINALKNFISNAEFSITKFSSSTKTECPTFSPVCKTYVVYELVIQRYALYYIINLIIPSALITELCLIGMFSPTSSEGERTEKFNLGITTLLALSVFLLIVSNSTPATSETIPLIGIYFLLDIAQLSVGLIASVFVLKLQMRGTGGKKVSGFWLKLLKKEEELASHGKESALVEYSSGPTDVQNNEASADYVRCIHLLLIEWMELKKGQEARKAVDDAIKSDWESVATTFELICLIGFAIANIALTVGFLVHGYILVAYR